MFATKKTATKKPMPKKTSSKPIFNKSKDKKLKSGVGSTDTLVETNIPFVNFLDVNASKIQAWYRNCKANRKLKEISKENNKIRTVDEILQERRKAAEKIRMLVMEGANDDAKNLSISQTIVLENRNDCDYENVVEYEDDFDVYDSAEEEELPNSEFREIKPDATSQELEIESKKPHNNAEIEYCELNIDQSVLDHTVCDTKDISLEPSYTMAQNQMSDTLHSNELSSVPPVIMDNCMQEANKFTSEIKSGEEITKNITLNENHSEAKKILSDELNTIPKDSPSDKRATESVSRILNLLKQVDSPKITAVVSDHVSSNVFDGVKQKILQQQLELDSRQKQIDALTYQLKNQKEQARQDAAEYQIKQKSQMNLQRQEYEKIVKRHLGFIDKIIKQKEQITTQAEDLTKQVADLERQYKEKLRNAQEQNQRELKQQREMWQAAERIKRDKWIAEKTKSIKDQTVQSLEPEIQKLIAQHKVQLRQSEENYRDLIAKEKQQLVENHQRQLEIIADKNVADRQRACEEEREFARQRYLKQLERDEMEYKAQKRKMLSEFDEEKHRIENKHSEILRKQDLSHQRAIENLKSDWEKERQLKETQIYEISKKNAEELNRCREKFQIEKEEWQNAFQKKMEQQFKIQQNKFKEKMIQQRDAEIELVVQRLESESGSSNSDYLRRHRMEIEKLKQIHADETKEIRDQHSLALDKLLLVQQQFKALQEAERLLQKEILKLEHTVMTKNAQLAKQKEELERLNSSEECLTESIRADFEKQLTLNANKISELKHKLDAMERAHIQEMDLAAERLKSAIEEKNSIIVSVEQKVVEALQNKDTIISQLSNQLEESNIRAKHLEQLIEKQRHELLEAL